MMGRTRADDSIDEPVIEECADLLDRHYRGISFNQRKVELTRLEVEGFSAIKEKDVEVDGNTVLFGQNSAGKTSFLNAILFNLLGIPESAQARRRYGLTELVHRESSMARTEGYWQVDESEYLIQRFLETRGRGGAYTRHDEPRLVLDPAEHDVEYDQRNTQAEVSEATGLLPLEQFGFDRFGLLSLFFVMNKNFRLFLDWSDQADLIDLLFGLNLTNVISAVDRKIEEEYKVTEEHENAPMELGQLVQERKDIIEDLNELRQERNRIRANLSDKNDRLDAVEDVLEGENRLNRLQSRHNDLQNRLFDLKEERREAQEEIRQTENAINRYEDTDIKQDLETLADELRDLMTVPDRCPICTNDVDADQREHLVHEQKCPLCEKPFPENRIRVEREHQITRSLTSVQKERREELDELQSDRDHLIAEEELLTERIEEVQGELDAVRDQIEESDTSEYVEQREELRREVRDLREEAVDIEVRIDAKDSRLTEVEEGIDNLEALHQEVKDIRRKKAMLERFKRIVRGVRDEQRSSVKNQLRAHMMDTLQYFSQGLFGDVSEVVFSEGANYDFELYTSNDVYRSADADESTAEVVLHALLFHSSILKLLTESRNGFPFRMFVIDAPFSNELDAENAADIIGFLDALPDILSEFQVVISVADTAAMNISDLEADYTIVEF